MRCSTTPSATPIPTAQAWRVHHLWCDGGWPGSCHELRTLSELERVLDTAGVATCLTEGSGLARLREHRQAPVGDRRTKNRLGAGQRAFNRCQTGPRVLVERAIGRLANAWALRRWRGLPDRVRDVYRATGALIARTDGSTGSRHKAASRTLSVSRE